MSAKPNKPSIPDISQLVGGLVQQATKGQATKQNEWWQTYYYPETVQFKPSDIIGCARSALYTKAMQGGVVYEVGKEKTAIVDKGNLDELIESFDGRLIYSFDGVSGISGLFYVFTDGAVMAQWLKDMVKMKIHSYLTIVTLNEKKVELFNRHYSSCFKDEQVETYSD